MSHELYEIFFVSGASAMALVLVRFRDRQRRKAIEIKCMRRMLSTACK